MKGQTLKIRTQPRIQLQKAFAYIYELPRFFYLIVKMPGNNSSVRSEYLLITPSLTLLCLRCHALIFCALTTVLRTEYPAVLYPAGLLFFFTLTLLCAYFTFTDPAVRLPPLFDYHLLCRDIIFLRTYPAVP